ncbi:MAG: polysaccharide biosynthesis/export family protein [Pseudolabrys sp.]
MRQYLRLVTWASIALLFLVLSGCNSPNATSNSASQFTALAKQNQTTTEYVIAPQDVLQVTVFQVPDLSKSVQVNGAGDITLPLIGQVRVSGKTIEEAQQDIAVKLGKKYVQSPQVTVLVTKSGQRVTVNGSVKSPAVLTVEGKLTLSQAIAATGGLGELANSNRVHVARISNELVKDTIFDLDQIQAGAIADPVLQGGDIVVVEDSNGKVVLKNLKDLLPFAVLAAVL